MKVIITLAGAGARFKAVGIDEPKHQIVVRGKSLFQWSLLSLQHFFDSEFIFILREGAADLESLKREVRQLGIKHSAFVTINQMTDGQASTVLEAEKYLTDYDIPILIYNIDTYVEPDALKLMPHGDGWLPVFKAEGERWSFVRFNNEKLAIEVTEKKRISDFGSIGLYYFSSFKLYKECYQQHDFSKDKERYIAPLYQTLITKFKRDVFVEEIPTNKVHVLGTPEDIVNFAPEFKGRLIQINPSLIIFEQK